jgi:outer membrane protein TolC
MKHLLALLFTASLAQAVAASPPSADAWREANERVDKAGGWKAYAREIQAEKSPESPTGAQALLSIEDAVKKARSVEPAREQTLAAVSRKHADYPSLRDHERAALTHEARMVAQVSTLYLAAVAAQERVTHRQQVAEVASVAAELATRMQKVGNLNVLHQAEERLSAAQTQRALSEARVSAGAAREALIRRLQLNGAHADFRLPARLPDAPEVPSALSTTDSVLLSVQTTSPEVIALQSEVRQALLARNEAHAQVQHHRKELLPLQKQISEEHLLHYNGMIIGIFELLKDAKYQTEAVEAYLRALLAYWQAEHALTPTVFALREQLAQFRRDAWK